MVPKPSLPRVLVSTIRITRFMMALRILVPVVPSMFFNISAKIRNLLWKRESWYYLVYKLKLMSFRILLYVQLQFVLHMELQLQAIKKVPIESIQPVPLFIEINKCFQQNAIIQTITELSIFW